VEAEALAVRMQESAECQELAVATGRDKTVKDNL
jgi:hypothetical protein